MSKIEQGLQLKFGGPFDSVLVVPLPAKERAKRNGRVRTPHSSGLVSLRGDYQRGESSTRVRERVGIRNIDSLG